MGQAFKPLGVNVRFWKSKLQAGSTHRFSVVLTNDTDKALAGKLTFSLGPLAGRANQVTEGCRFRGSALGQKSYDLELTFRGRRRFSDQSHRQLWRTVAHQSRRRVAVQRKGRTLTEHSLFLDELSSGSNRPIDLGRVGQNRSWERRSACRIAARFQRAQRRSIRAARTLERRLSSCRHLSYSNTPFCGTVSVEVHARRSDPRYRREPRAIGVRWCISGSRTEATMWSFRRFSRYLNRSGPDVT
jgi:hypothetical protein